MSSKFNTGDLVESKGTGIVYTIIGDRECSVPHYATKRSLCNSCNRRLFVGIITNLDTARITSSRDELLEHRNLCPTAIKLVRSVESTD